MINKILFVFFIINLQLLANQTFEEIILEEVDKQHEIIELDEEPHQVQNDPMPQRTKSFQEEKKPQKSCRINNLIEGKVGYFWPMNDVFKSMYGGGVIYGVEASFRFYKDLYFWFDANYFSESGRTLTGRSSTRLRFVPLGAGLKFLFRVNRRGDGLYLAAGVLPGYAHVYTDSPYLITNQSNWGVGGAFKSGFLVSVYDCIVFDFFVDYKYLKITFKKRCDEDRFIYCRTGNLSGLTAGFGLGFKF